MQDKAFELVATICGSCIWDKPYRETEDSDKQCPLLLRGLTDDVPEWYGKGCQAYEVERWSFDD